MNGPSTDTPPSAASNEPPRGRGIAVLKAVGRYVVAAAFLASALTKIFDPSTFAGQVAHSGLPPWFAQILVAGLPWLELTCGFCLALGVAVREAAAIVCVLLAVFLVYSLFHRSDGECGCLLFPRPLRPANQWPWLPMRNLALLACAAWQIWPRRPPHLAS